MTFMRFLHKWIGAFLGIQLVLWMLSGFVMALIDHDVVEGHHLQNHDAHHMGPIGAVAEGLDFTSQVPAGETLHEVRAGMLFHTQVVFVRTDKETRAYNAQTGEKVVVDESLARQIAEADFSGDGKVVSVTPITAPTMETRESVGPGWRVDFDNPENSSLYLSAETGQIWERRHDTWRVFDIFWMLHIMDYSDRKDFNNWIVILSAWIVLWLTLSGFIMLIENLRNGDFNLLRAARSRSYARKATICDADGSHVLALEAKGDRNLFEVLGEEDIHLPSSCGGGGSCGLCRVRMEPAPEATPADIREIPSVEIDAGYRLACQHRDFDERTVKLPHGLLDAEDVEMEVVSHRFVTPLICEVRLRPVNGQAVDFTPGDYMQVTIPAYQASISDMDVPEELKSAIAGMTTNMTVGTEEDLHRTYSIANCPHEMDPDILLNVKFALPTEVGKDMPAGAGSAWISSLMPGMKVQVRGPFGDFALKRTDAEKIFIGGGAGMAPLRSMLLHLMTGNFKGPVSFWYGARHEEDIYYHEDFDVLADSFENFKCHVALSDVGEDSPWDGYMGFVHEVVLQNYLKDHADPAACEYYLCGPPPMLKACLEMLADLGVPDSQIDFDDFGN